jgi:hypothetical protein
MVLKLSVDDDARSSKMAESSEWTALHTAKLWSMHRYNKGRIIYSETDNGDVSYDARTSHLNPTQRITLTVWMGNFGCCLAVRSLENMPGPSIAAIRLRIIEKHVE